MTATETPTRRRLTPEQIQKLRRIENESRKALDAFLETHPEFKDHPIMKNYRRQRNIPTGGCR